MLRLANPVPMDALDGAGVGLEVVDVLERVLAEPPVGPEPPRRRPARRRLPLVVAGVTALAAVGWTVVALRGQPSKPLTIGCYAAADVDSRLEIVVADGRPPEEVCRDLWRRGTFGAVPVPDLAACVLASGTVGVFPVTGGDTCVAVQAVRLQPGAGAGQPDPAALRQALVEALRAEGCLGAGPALELVGRYLAGGGFHGWSVDVAGTFGPERPCASLAFDVPSSRVLIVPVPRTP